MRHVALIALACAGLAIQARSSAACEADENGEVEDCEEDIAAFDERFDEDATFLDRMKLDLSGRFLRHVVIRWSDDDEDQYVEWEIDTDFEGLEGTGVYDGPDGIDEPDGTDEPDGIDDTDFDEEGEESGTYTPEDDFSRV